MAVLINRGIDLHRWFAAEIANKPIEKVTKEERQAAKAANFGFPGGLGIGSFVAYAQATFGVEISEQEAKRLREKWLDAFPEMRLYLADPWLSRYNFAKGPTSDEAINLAIARRIAAGLCQKNGDAYKPSTTKWFFEQVLPRIAPHKSGIVSGSADLANELARTSVHTLSGRIRANCYYSQAKNTPFQGLASDGAKEALFDLCSEGYTPNAFIHDEVLVEVPTDSNLEMHGHRIAEIMIAAMQRVVPDVKIAVEWAVADRWYKGAKLVRNEAGVVVPYTE
jgi:DNA polymerase I-like protein with 3'-5' exonuclease and polymerase domains